MSENQAKILMVEDEALVAEDIRNIVEAEGHDVADVLARGEAALEKATEESYDLALMDIKLKGDLDGIETAHRLKDEFDLYVIYLTAYSNQELLDRAKQTEPLGYLNKPVDRLDLVTTLQVALRKSRMNEKLRASEAKFRTLVETNPDVIYRLTPDGVFDYLSPAVKKLGWTPEHLVGEHFRKILFADEYERVSRVHVLPEYEGEETGPDSAPRLFDERRTSPRETRGLEVKIKLGPEAAGESDGEYRFCEVHAAAFYDLPVDNPRKKYQGTIGVIRDVHERKNRQQKIRRQTRRLASFGQMAAGLMHEVNNANAYVKGNLDYLEKAWSMVEENLEPADRPARLDSVLTEYSSTIESMREGADRIEAMTDKVGGLVSSGTSTEESFNAVSRLNKAIDLLGQSPKFEGKVERIEIKTDFSDAARTIELRGDPYEFLEIFVNLLNNSVRALESEADPQIDLKAELEEEKLKVSVADNGPGVPEELESRIFEPFITSGNPETGTGLGLSVVEDFVDSFGGEIELDSRLNEGTEFVLEFPVPAAEN